MRKDTPLEAEIRKAGVKPRHQDCDHSRYEDINVKTSTIITLIVVGIAIICGMWWVYGQWKIQKQMIDRGQEVGRVCLPPGHAVIANGVEWGCVGDPYQSYQQVLYLPN